MRLDAAMSSSLGGQPQRISLEDLAALNREISALVASGLPLEPGLRQVAEEFSGPTSVLAQRLAGEMAAGHTLEEAIETQGAVIPPVYRAVVAAGIRSGRLAAALEGYAETAARMAALRRIAGQAVVYPIIVIIVAWVMLVLVVTTILPGYGVFELPNEPWLTRISISGWASFALALVVPATIIALALLWWRRSAAAAGGEQRGRWLQWAPGARRTAVLSGNANFADLLQLLLACRVPLPEALPLAATASGAPSLAAPANDLAEGVAAGQPLHAQTALLRRFPPLVRTVLLADLPENRLIAGLKRARDNYRERAASWLTDMAVLLPVALTFALAIGVVGVYAVIILQPYYTILYELAHWGVR